MSNPVLCAGTSPCPALLPVLCPDGRCVATVADCTAAPLPACPPSHPIRCTDGSCVASLSHCDPPACPADINRSGTLSVQDIFDFLAAFFTVPPPRTADFNNSGAISVQDLFDFLAAYFAGCA